MLCDGLNKRQRETGAKEGKHLVGEHTEARATKVDRPPRRSSLPQTNAPAQARARHPDALVPVVKDVSLVQLSLHPPLLPQSDEYRRHHAPQQKTRAQQKRAKTPKALSLKNNRMRALGSR